MRSADAKMPPTWRRAAVVPLAQALLALSTLVALVADRRFADRWLRTDRLTFVMLALVALVGAVVVRYSARYLAGDPGERRAARLLAATLAAVTAVVVANDVVVLTLAWTATSLALHGLLTFFGDRPAAIAAAHKKFVLARCADACMLGAVGVLVATHGTTRIDEIAAASTTAHAAAVLIAVAAVLKCAQLPFHGWLIQVMEAPTPVSALLHAGVVNLGGFVLLRFAPLIDATVAARTLLVVVGMATVVVAALVMTTRISVKVALAWSTCAQMGFMLVQCGLGLWELAVLHLVAHSLYKAHAFLSAGTTVERAQRDRLMAHGGATTARAMTLATTRAAAVTAIAVGLWIALPVVSAPTGAAWVFVAAVALAIVPLAIGPWRATSIATALAVPLLYLVGHDLASRVVGHGRPAPGLLVALVAAGLLLLFITTVVVTVAPGHRAVRRIRPWLYRGLFLDEVFTRIAFTVWPPPPVRHRDGVLI